MSRIGKKVITIPSGVEVNVVGQELTVRGPKGTLNLALPLRIKVNSKEQSLNVDVNDPALASDRALWGLYRALIANMIKGATKGFEKKLEISGIGYRATVSGNKLILNIGFSHPVELQIPEGLSVSVDKNIISVGGADKHKVGQFAAVLHAQKPPEPYKGKGIRYETEVVRRKAGKAAK